MSDPFLQELQEHIFASSKKLWFELIATLPESPLDQPQQAQGTLQKISNFLRELSTDMIISELSQWTEIFSEISQQVGSEDFCKSVIATNGNLKNQLLRFFDELFSQWEKIGVPDEKQMSPLVRESFQDLKNQLSLSKDKSSLLEPNQAEQKDANPHGLPESLLCLKARCEQNHFLVPMESVLEVSSRRKISALPETVQNFEGLITLRGEMIPVLSSQTIFTKNPQNQSDAENSDPFNFLIICRVGENKFALPVF